MKYKKIYQARETLKIKLFMSQGNIIVADIIFKQKY